jgi:hypothetical protein
MTEPAGIEQADHNMAPEEILAWFLASGRVGELAEWRAAIRAGLSLGFTLPGMYQIHHSMSSAAPLRRPTAASFGEILGIRNKEPGDTITENWRHIDKSLHPILQWGWRVLTIGLLGWVMLHFGGSWS